MFHAMSSIRSRPGRAMRNSPRRPVLRPGLSGPATLLVALVLPAAFAAAAPGLPPAPATAESDPVQAPLPASPGRSDNDPRAQAERLFQTAVAAHARDPDNVTNTWYLGRAAFDRAEFARDPAERAALAEQAIAALRPALARHTNVAALPYYLGMNLGQLARTRSLGALPLVREMETLFQRARELDEQFDEAGPDRNLGLLYLEAPGWPLSIGHRGRARHHLERAVTLAPNYPENRLNLLEARLRWGERDLHAALDQLERLWPAACVRYAGTTWVAAWADWERRRQALRVKLQPATGAQPNPSSPAEPKSSTPPPDRPAPPRPGGRRRSRRLRRLPAAAPPRR